MVEGVIGLAVETDCGMMFTFRTVMFRFRMAGFRLANCARELVLMKMVFVPGTPGVNCADELPVTDATLVGIVTLVLVIGRICVSPTRTKFFMVVVLLGSTLMMTGWNLW